MALALSRKWRPARFDQVVGQEHVTRTLRGAVAADRVGHAYLFCGPRGTGKTTTARLLAKAVNCLDEELAQRPCDDCRICQTIDQGRFLDLIEIDAASNTGVDDIRDLRDKINFAPSEGRYKVYIIDEVHMLSTAAFNALLKTLEEPPPHVIFILATTEEHKVPLTIKSRCQQFNFRLLTTAEISGRLEWLAAQEAIKIEPAALAMIARHGAGSIRDAESLLDQLVTAPGDTITLERAQLVLGTASTTAVQELVTAWLAGDAATGLSVINATLESGADARQFSRQMVAYLRHLLLLNAAGADLPLDVLPEVKESMLAQAQRARRPDLIQAIRRFSEAALAPVTSWQPQLPLEMAFFELLPIEPDSPTSLAQPGLGDATRTETSGGASQGAVAAHPDRAAGVQKPAEPAVAAVTEMAVGEMASTTEKEVALPAAEGVRSPDPVKSEPPAGDMVTGPIDDSDVTIETPVAGPSPANEPVTALSLAYVNENWTQLLTRLGQLDRNLPALLTMSKPLTVEHQTLILGFDYPIFKEKFELHLQAAQLIGQVLSELSGGPCSVQPVITSQYVPNVDRTDFQALADELGGVVRDEG